MQKSVFFLLLFMGMLSCNSTHKADLTIACAASAQFAIAEMADQFAEDRDLKIDVISGSSGKLTTQIINGAPFDLFFSANMSYPYLLHGKGLTLEPAKLYGKGIPVFWTMNNSFDLSRIGWLMQMDKVNKVAIPDPKNAPYGEKAMQFLEKYEFYSRLHWKFIFGENISQVNEFILSENAALGVTAKSIVTSPKLRGKGKYKELDKEFWIDQGVVILKGKKAKKTKLEFLDFVFSAKGQEILKKYGFAF